MRVYQLFIIAGLTAVLSFSASADLINPGFESGSLTNWMTFGQGWRTGGGGDANSGSFGAVNDVLTTDGDAFRGIFQEVAVTPGQDYEAGVFIRTVNLEASQSWFELQWLDAGSGVISQLQSSFVTADQPYTYMTVGTVTAPSNAVSASVRGIVNMTAAPTTDTDFHTFDDFTFDAVPEPSVLHLLGMGALALGLIACRK